MTVIEAVRAWDVRIAWLNGHDQHTNEADYMEDHLWHSTNNN